MSTLRSFHYDDPNYTLVRRENTGVWDKASATAFGIFRCRAQCVVTQVTVIVTSVASAAKVIFSPTRGTSINTASLFTIVSATSAGAYTIKALDLTLTTMEQLSLTHDDTGDYMVIYDYQILPQETLPTRA